MMRQKCLVGFLVSIVTVGAFSASVENVRAKQVKGTKEVEVYYDLIAPEGGSFNVSVQFSAPGSAPEAKSLSGAVGKGIKAGKNKRLVWNAGKDWPNNFSEEFVCTVDVGKEGVEGGGTKQKLLSGMVRIPAGTNAGVDPDFGPYSLTVKAFYMDRTEVTYAFWMYVYNWAVEHGYQFGEDDGGQYIWWYTFYDGYSDYHEWSYLDCPVCCVGWFDVIKWCNARSEMDGHKAVYLLSNGEVYRTGLGYAQANFENDGYRLPTVKEWEYAARGGMKGKRFPWGNTISHSQANYNGAYPDDEVHPAYDLSYGPHPQFAGHSKDGSSVWADTAPVGCFASNGYGLYDMIGNAVEMCTGDEGVVVDVGYYSSSGRHYPSYSGCLKGGSYDDCGCRIGWTNGPGVMDLFTQGFRTVRR